MSNVEDWERRHALPFGCAVVMTIGCFAFAAFFLWYAASPWLFGYQHEMLPLPLLGAGGFFLGGGVAAVWRLAKGKSVPYVGRGGEAPPVIEVYDFLPNDRDANSKSEGPDKTKR